MIVGEAIVVMIQAMETRGSENAALPHPTAESSAHFDGSIVKPSLKSHDGARWCAQALGKGDHDRVGALGELGERIPRRHCGIPETRAVEMNRAAVLTCDVSHRSQSGNWSYKAAGAVVCVLETDERRAHRAVRCGAHASEQRGSVHHGTIARYGAQLSAAQRSCRRIFEVVNVRIDVCQHLGPSFGEQPDRDLVGHRPRWTKDSALLA
ncbi:MAG TPA: hypothetical protein VGQ52_09760 [Gemmatimonadaceae bacterium]|nr:hypothetical protein [Gemmatimonadaceae bacterium]